MFKKSVMLVNLNLSVFFLPFLLLSPSSSLKLGPIVVIQKFGYHGNLTSHFSSLFNTNLIFKYFLYAVGSNLFKQKEKILQGRLLVVIAVRR